MSTHNFKCTNLTGCDTALSNRIIELEDGEEELFPECTRKLVPFVQNHKKTPRLILASGATAVMIVLGLAGFLVKSRQPAIGKATKPPIVAVAPAVYPCGLEPVQSADVVRLLQYLKQGMNYASQKKPDLALTEFQQVLKIDPNFLGAAMNIGSAYLLQDKYPEAEASFARELNLIGCLKQMNDESLAKFAYMEEVGARSAAEKQQMQSSAFRSHLNRAEANVHYSLACLNSRRSLKGPALAELEKAISGGLIDRRSLQADPDLKGIRATNEFKTLMARYNPPAGGNP
ncbi:MAG: hypothetical protein LAP21_18875 [Acidobacteriia bacterium]|nr:hypothetical protein [Terriglobia bacterium]